MAPSSPRNTIEGKERLVRNRLRWLEGNWDGKPPPKSPWTSPGPRHTGGRRRATHRRSERAPRWGSPTISSSTRSAPSAENNKISGDHAAGGSVSSHSCDSILNNTSCAKSPTGSSSRSAFDQNRGRILKDDKANGSNNIGVCNSDPGGGTFRSRVVDARARVRRYALSLPVRARRLRPPAFRALSPSASSDGGQSSDDQGLSSGAEDAGSLVYGYDGVCSSGSPSAFPGKGGRRWRATSPPPLSHHRREHLAARANIPGEKAAGPWSFHRPEKQPALSGEQPDGEQAQDGSFGRIPSRESLSEVSVTASGFDSEDLPEEDAPEGSLRSSQEIFEIRKTMLTGIAEQGRSFHGNLSENGGDANYSQCSSSRAPICDESDGQGRRELEEEIASLKEELKKAELKQAATEETVASLLQRARAAELARDVKEIQIRNLEVRLARYTKSDKHFQEACAQWAQRFQDETGAVPAEFRRREPLPAVAEEPSSLFEVDESDSSSSSNTTCESADTGRRPSITIAPVSPSTSQESSLSPVRGCRQGGAAGTMGVWGARPKKSDVRSRRGRGSFGARSARASGGAALPMAVVLEEATGSRALTEKGTGVGIS